MPGAKCRYPGCTGLFVSVANADAHMLRCHQLDPHSSILYENTPDEELTAKYEVELIAII